MIVRATESTELKTMLATVLVLLLLINPDICSAEEEEDEDDDDDNDNEGDDYDAMCLHKREPGWRDNPTLFFFASSNHSTHNLGCSKENMRLDLDITKSFRHEYEDADDLLLNNVTIERDLIESGLFDPAKETYVIVHGFLASWDGDPWMCQLKDLILNHTDANVFIVDWSGGAQPMLPIDYGKAVTNTNYVAEVVATFIGGLVSASGGQVSKFQLIGHSLGAHISGFIGYALAGRLGKITALDPAGPCFSSRLRQTRQRLLSPRLSGAEQEGGVSAEPASRLSRDSANLVLALHTDIGLFGLDENVADYDVYVNSGSQQPGCPTLTKRLDDLLNLRLLKTLDLNFACSHSFGHELLETIVAADRLDDEQVVRAAQSTTSGSAQPEVESDTEQCYALAYECRSWEAFRLGECGYCSQSQQVAGRCVYMGLAYGDQESATTSSGATLNQLASEANNDDSGNDDYKFNEEPDQDATAILGPPGIDGKQRHDERKYFVKSGNKMPHCLYHYQVIVATDEDEALANKVYYFLQLPLDDSGRLNSSDGDSLTQRMVQVSHELAPGTPTHSILSDTFVKDAARSEDNATLIGADTARTVFYTALITFEAPKTSDRARCSAKENKLCRPLADIQEASLWSRTDQQLARVKWVALNYMSGVNAPARAGSSQLLVPAASGSGEQASLARVKRGLGSLIASPVTSLDCLMAGEGAFKCNRRSNELKYSVPLRPLKRRQRPEASEPAEQSSSMLGRLASYGSNMLQRLAYFPRWRNQ